MERKLSPPRGRRRRAATNPGQSLRQPARRRAAIRKWFEPLYPGELRQSSATPKPLIPHNRRSVARLTDVAEERQRIERKPVAAHEFFNVTYLLCDDNRNVMHNVMSSCRIRFI